MTRKFEIAMNLNPTESPFGGGNQFLQLLVEHLKNQGHNVHFKLKGNLDFVFILDPRWNHPLSAFRLGELSRYLLLNQNTIVIHRINECDERKNTRNMNRKLRLANYLANYTVFVSIWLKSLDLAYSGKVHERFSRPSKVILNGSDPRVFYPDKLSSWDGKSKLKLVTHHWSANEMKGLKLYKKIDDLLSESYFFDRFTFSYIGNVPANANFKNTHVIPPLHGRQLASELRSNHVYVTGSLNEPGGNHQNEAGLSGLPIICLDSGSMREYCEGFGLIMNSVDDVYDVLLEIRDRYFEFDATLKSFPHTSERMLREYDELLEKLDQERMKIVSQHSLLSDLQTFLRLQLPI